MGKHVVPLSSSPACSQSMRRFCENLSPRLRTFLQEQRIGVFAPGNCPTLADEARAATLTDALKLRLRCEGRDLAISRLLTRLLQAKVSC